MIAPFALAFLLGATQSDNSSLRSPVEIAAACDSGDVDACVSLGTKYYLGTGVKKNRTLANKLFSRACDKRHAEACAILARSYLNGDGVSKNDKIAFIAADRACDLDNLTNSVGLACEIKGKIYSEGLGRQADYGKGFAYHGQSCEMEQQTSCVLVAKGHRLGYHPESGGSFPVAKDLGKAKELAGQACTQKSAAGCYELAQMPGQDNAIYARSMAYSCNYGSGASCFELAKSMDRGRGRANASSGVQSIEHYRREACRLKTSAACSWKSRATLAREAREREEFSSSIRRKNPTLSVLKAMADQGTRACLFSNDALDKIFGLGDVCEPLLVLSVHPEKLRFQFSDRVATLKLDRSSVTDGRLKYRGNLVVINNSRTARAQRGVRGQKAPPENGEFRLYSRPKASRFSDGRNRKATRYVLGEFATGRTKWLIAVSPTKRGRVSEILGDLVD